MAEHFFRPPATEIAGASRISIRDVSVREIVDVSCLPLLVARGKGEVMQSTFPTHSHLG